MITLTEYRTGVILNAHSRVDSAVASGPCDPSSVDRSSAEPMTYPTPRVQLAAGTVTNHDSLSVWFTRPSGDREWMIVAWPPQASAVTPARFSEAMADATRTLAERESGKFGRRKIRQTKDDREREE
jgi:hypothetical protein